MQRKAFVLLSGGLDSTTALYMANKDFAGYVEGVSINYGQRHEKELEYAKKSCGKLGIPHTTLYLGHLLSGAGVMLTDTRVSVPDVSYANIKGVSPTYVPFRNGTMLSCITALAQKYVKQQIDQYVQETINSYESASSQELVQHATNRAKDLVAIYAGQHAEDALNWAYPDCTFEFLGAMANAIYVGTYSTIRLITPFVFSSKADIVTKGHELAVPFENTWSCYKGEVFHCGMCPTCRSRKEAFQHAGFKDPTVYAQSTGIHTGECC